MKHFLTLLSFALIAFGSQAKPTFTRTAFIANGISKIHENDSKPECSVTQTRSYTATGNNCDGTPVSATATHSCTQTASTCEAAGGLASVCALGMAHNEVWTYLNGLACLPPAN